MSERKNLSVKRKFKLLLMGLRLNTASLARSLNYSHAGITLMRTEKSIISERFKKLMQLQHRVRPEFWDEDFDLTKSEIFYTDWEFFNLLFTELEKVNIKRKLEKYKLTIDQ